MERRTVAGPSSAVQWVFSGGPYTVVIARAAGPGGVPAAVSEAGLHARRGPGSAPRVCPLGQRVGGWVIHFPAVVCTSLAQRDLSVCRAGDGTG